MPEKAALAEAHGARYKTVDTERRNSHAVRVKLPRAARANVDS